MKYKSHRMIKDWLVLITVFEVRSFTVAAKKLYCSVASISKSIAKLEDIFETVFFIRNAHQIEVTAAGYVAYNRAKEIQKTYQSLFSEINHRDQVIKGKIRFSAPTILCEYVANHWVYEYLNQNDGVDIQLLSRDRTDLSVVSPEFDDLVFKSGIIESPTLVHESLGKMNFVLCASPDYLQNAPLVNTPDQLSEHWILKVDHPFLKYPLTLTHGEQTVALNLEHNQNLTSNNISALLELTLAGKGIGVGLPEWLAQSHIASGELVQILPQWQLPQMDIYLAWRQREHYSRLFLDFKEFVESKWQALLMPNRVPEVSDAISESD